MKKTLREWSQIIQQERQIFIMDYDGFDRTDPHMLDKEYTYEEFEKGLLYCTIMGMGAKI